MKLLVENGGRVVLQKRVWMEVHLSPCCDKHRKWSGVLTLTTNSWTPPSLKAWVLTPDLCKYTFNAETFIEDYSNQRLLEQLTIDMAFIINCQRQLTHQYNAFH